MYFHLCGNVWHSSVKWVKFSFKLKALKLPILANWMLECQLASCSTTIYIYMFEFWYTSVSERNCALQIRFDGFKNIEHDKLWKYKATFEREYQFLRIRMPPN